MKHYPNVSHCTSDEQIRLQRILFMSFKCIERRVRPVVSQNMPSLFELPFSVEIYIWRNCLRKQISIGGFYTNNFFGPSSTYKIIISQTFSQTKNKHFSKYTLLLRLFTDVTAILLKCEGIVFTKLKNFCEIQILKYFPNTGYCTMF